MLNLRRYRSVHVGVIVLSGLMSCNSSASQARPTDPSTSAGVFTGIGGGPSAPVGGDPFGPGSRLVSLAQAEAAVGSPLPRPDDPIGSDGSVSKVWMAVNGNTVQIDIVYRSGLQVELWAAPKQLRNEVEQRKTFTQEAAENAAQTNGAASVVEVDGIPALLVPDKSAVFANGRSQQGPGELTFALDGYAVDMFGHFTNDELMRAASSVASAPQTAP